MGRIVGAFGTSHVLLNRTGCEEKADRVFAGMQEIGRRIDELDPDLVVIVANDHFINLDLAHEIPLAVPMQEEYVPAGDMGLPPVTFKGFPEFSGGFVDYANANGFDLAILREYRACHGLATPSFFCARPDGRRVVPIITNTLMDPPASPSRCYALGRRLAEYIEQVRPADERVVVVGTGGLSHWVGVEDQGAINFDFDETVFRLFAEGRAEELSEYSRELIIEKAGNGGLEIINWLVMAGAVHGKKGHKVYYEAIPEWFTGMSGVEIEID
ncbi:MAG: AmmeMemoRadiSam system protein B [Pseudomonas sp.]|nr:AmmeMemoRadiSam system protein B [Pseudomonas sp.]